MTAPESRPLDPAERYFYLLDRLWPMNVVAVAELDRALDPDRLRDVWQALAARMALASSRLTSSDGVTLVLEAAHETPLAFEVSPPGPWETAVQQEQITPFSVSDGPLMRIRYAPRAEAGSALMLTVHHAVGDARTALWILQDLIRMLAAGHSRSAVVRGLPIPLHAIVKPAHRWTDNRQEMMQLLRELRDERDRAGRPAEIRWHDRAAEGRDLQLDQIVFSRSETAAIIKRARGARATVHGALGAACLSAVGSLLNGAREHNLVLTTPVDLRDRLSPAVPARAPGMYVTLLSTTHTVGAGAFAETARVVSEELRFRLKRGEGELFYTLARPDAVSPDEEGLASIGSAIDAAPQAVAVSNVGVIDETGDPEWLRSLSFVLAPTPNQVAFVAATTYRGALVLNMASDRLRLDASIARRLADEAARHLQPG